MHLTIFDLDHTLLTVNSSFRFGIFLYRHHFFSLWALAGCLSDYARYKWLKMPIYDLHHRTFERLFKGHSLHTIRSYVTQFLDESLDAILYLPILHRLRQAQAQGNEVVILSSAPDFLVKEIAHRLHISHWQATHYQIDDQEQLIAIASVMEGEDKARYLKQLSIKMNLPCSAITVYSDSYLDLPVLKMAGHAIAVRPDAYLRRICLQNGWEIL